MKRDTRASRCRERLSDDLITERHTGTANGSDAVREPYADARPSESAAALLRQGERCQEGRYHGSSGESQQDGSQEKLLRDALNP